MSARTFLKRYGDNVWFASVGVFVVTVLIFAGVRDYRAQAENKARCAAMHGRYLKTGDKYFNGLCLKADAKLWER